MPRSTASRWTLATGAGFCLAFLSFVPMGALFGLFAPESMANIDAGTLSRSLDPAALPEGLDRATYETMYRFMLVQHVVMYALFGVILGSFQRYALRDSLRRGWPWLLATSAGFVLILVLEGVRPHMVIGPHAGPLEPIMIALGGGGLAGVFQWLHLRRQGVDATKWLGFWVVGIVVGIAAAAVTLTAVGAVLEAPVRRLFSPETADRIGWWIFFGVYGAVVGVVAGWVSRGRMAATAERLRTLHPLG